VGFGTCPEHVSGLNIVFFFYGQLINPFHSDKRYTSKSTSIQIYWLSRKMSYNLCYATVYSTKF